MPGWGAEAGPVDWTKKGYITLSLNPRTHGPSREYFTTPIYDHHLWNIENPQTYYYRAAYMDCLRGIDFLFTRPEINTDKIGLQGSSQGGAFSLAVAALDQRIACAAVDVPFLGNIPDFTKLATVGAGTKFGQMIDGSERGRNIQKTLSYIDVAFMAQRIKCPVLVCVGLQDRVCPPLTGITVFNHLNEKDSSLKRLVMDPVADHEVTGLMWQENHAWLDKYLK
jgi:cephalosporin-C deacetylase